MIIKSRRDIHVGQPLLCLVHPNTCRSYLVYRLASSIYGTIYGML